MEQANRSTSGPQGLIAFVAIERIPSFSRIRLATCESAETSYGSKEPGRCTRTEGHHRPAQRVPLHLPLSGVVDAHLRAKVRQYAAVHACLRAMTAGQPPPAVHTGASRSIGVSSIEMARRPPRASAEHLIGDRTSDTSATRFIGPRAVCQRGILNRLTLFWRASIAVSGLRRAYSSSNLPASSLCFTVSTSRSGAIAP